MEKIIIDGIPMYTNDKLKDYLIEIVNKYLESKTKELLINSINNNILIPIINEPSKVKQFILKLRRIKPLRIYGTSSNGKAYVLMDRNLSKKDIIDTALHELIHVSYMLETNSFNKINLPLYVKFYSFYYKKIFESNSYDKEKFTEFLRELMKPVFYWKTYDEILYDAFKDYTKLPKEKFEEMLELITYLCDNNNHATADYNNVAIALLRTTYRHLFGGMDYTSGMGAELWSTSEIIAILSTINPSHPNVVKSLSLIKPGKKAVIKTLTKKILK